MKKQPSYADRVRETELGVMLCLLAKWSVLPDLYSFFVDNEKEFLRFLDWFGGATLTVPSRRATKKLFRNAHIYRSYCESPTTENCERLASLYGLKSVTEVRAIAAEIQKLLDDEVKDFAPDLRKVSALLGEEVPERHRVPRILRRDKRDPTPDPDQ